MAEQRRNWWSPPQLDDPEQARAAQLLNRILLATMAATIALPVIITTLDLALVSRQFTSNAVLTLAAGLALALVATGLRFLLRRGNIILTGSFVTGALLLATTGSIITHRGLRDASIAGYFLAIAIAGLVLGGRGALLTGILAALGAGGVWLAEVMGAVTFNMDPLPGPFEIVTLLATLGLTAILLQHAARSIREGFDWARKNELDHIEVNRALQASQESLQARTVELERRARHLQTAADIAKLATGSISTLDLMQKAVEIVQGQFSFYHAAVYMLDETGTWAELSAGAGEAGRSLLARRYRLPVGSSSFVGWVTANRLARLAADVSQDPYYFKNPLLPQTQSEVTIPLIVGERLLGVLDVQSDQVSAFSEDDARALEAIADEVAVAIDRTRVLTETREELERIESMYRGREAASWRRIARPGKTTEFRIGRSAAPTGLPATEFAALERAALLGTTVVDPQSQEVAVPVHVRGQVVGTIAARRSLSGDNWSEDDVAAIEAVASQAGVALEMARQYTEEQRRGVELQMVNRVSQAVSQMLRLDSLFRVVHAQFLQLLGDVGMAIALFDPAHRSVAFPYAHAHGQALALGPEPLGEDQVSYVIRSQQPLILGERPEALAEALGVRLKGPRFKSWIGVPMMAGENAIGALALFDDRAEGRFTEDDVGLLTTIASQVAAAFQNASLLEQVQRIARRERLIREITAKVRRAPDMRTILETTARELGRALNASRSSIVLGKGQEGTAGQGGMSTGQSPSEQDASPSERGQT